MGSPGVSGASAAHAVPDGGPRSCPRRGSQELSRMGSWREAHSFFCFEDASPLSSFLRTSHFQDPSLDSETSS